MENYEILKSIEEFSTRLTELKEAIGLEKLKSKIDENEKIMASPDFYNDMKEAQKLLKQVKKDKDIVKSFEVISSDVADLNVLYEMQKNKEVEPA